MEPSRPAEQTWRMGVTGLAVAGIGVAAADPVVSSTTALAGVTAANVGAGAGLYKGGEHVRKEYFGYRYSRPFRVAQAGLVRTFQITRELTGMTVLENLLLAPTD